MQDFSPEALRPHLLAMMDTQERTATAPPPSKLPMMASLGIMGAGQVADALSTHRAVKRGASESNPVYGKKPSLGKLLAIKAATNVPLAVVFEKLHKHHPKLARGLALGVGGVGFGLAAHNSRQGKK